MLHFYSCGKHCLGIFPRMWLFALVSCQNISLHDFSMCQLPLCQTVVGMFLKLKCFRNFGQFYRQTVCLGGCEFNSVYPDCLFHLVLALNRVPGHGWFTGVDIATDFLFCMWYMKQMTEQIATQLSVSKLL